MDPRWPNPDITIPEFNPTDFSGHWIPRERDRPRNYRKELEGGKTTRPKPPGYGNPWPDMPKPDMPWGEISLSRIDLRNARCPCSIPGVLGFYLPWHIVAVGYANENGRQADDISELLRYNQTLPSCNRYGIHVCVEAIESYVSHFSKDGFDDNDQYLQYQQYCAYLTLIYVIAHEWGHYRSEVLAFQLQLLAESLTGSTGNLRTSYLAYFLYGLQNIDSCFEEVFAEWASLKFGVFNYHMKKPSFAEQLQNKEDVEATLRWMLTESMIQPSRGRPYIDITEWIDIQRLVRPWILERVSENRKSQNRSVNDHLRIDGIQSLNKGKMIDLLMHNQMQFAPGRFYNGIIQSSPLYYPQTPASAFYHLGEDTCMKMSKAPSSTDLFLHINLDSLSPALRNGSRLLGRVINDLMDNPDSTEIFLPIKIFPEILPMDSIYFHG